MISQIIFGIIPVKGFAKKVQSPEPTDNHSSELSFKIFSVLWAVATIFHMANSGLFDTELTYALLTITAMYVIIRPSMPSFIALITFQLFDVITRMPYVTNHWIFTAFVNLTILHALLYLMIKQKSLTIKGYELIDFFAPIVRIEVIILYFFAVLHKLNTGFFDPEVGCGTELLKSQNFGLFIPLTPQVLAYNAYFTIIVEALIPILICFRKTRNTGILLGILFHAALAYSAYNGFYDFSSVLLATYFLFIYQPWSKTISGIRKRFINSRPVSIIKEYSVGNLLLIIVSIIILFTIIYFVNRKLDTFKGFHLYFFWTLFVVAYLYCFIRFMLEKRTNKETQPRTLAIFHWSFIILPVIVFLNGMSPYLGLKTENSYSMFSNLRTEGGTNNHFFIPASFQIFNLQKDIVEIISSPDPYFQELAEKNMIMVLFEFKNLIKHKKPEQVEYLLNGRKEIYLAGEPSLPWNSYFLYKLLRFRIFYKDDPQPCRH